MSTEGGRIKLCAGAGLGESAEGEVPEMPSPRWILSLPVAEGVGWGREHPASGMPGSDKASCRASSSSPSSMRGELLIFVVLLFLANKRGQRWEGRCLQKVLVS